MKKFNFLLFFLIFNFCFASQKTNLEKRKNQIEKQVKQKTERINKIDSEKKDISSQIKKIEKEIVQINQEKVVIMSEIETVSKNIDYSEKNLNISSKELNRKKNQYSAKIGIWGRYTRSKGNKISNSLTRKYFKNLLVGDLGKIENIKNVQIDIKKVKAEIEQERRKLTMLQTKLENNKKQMDSKIAEKNVLISKLNKEKIGHQKDIKKLQAEKAQIEKQIRKILQNTNITRDKTTTTVPDAIKKIGGLSRPLNGPIVVRFGQKKGGVVSSNGVEIAANMGAQIKAAASGQVVFAGNFQGLTKVVMINYGRNLVGVYGNLIATKVSKGQSVTRGQIIGTLGKSSEGKTNLYYEVRFNSNLVNPEQCFK